MQKNKNKDKLKEFRKETGNRQNRLQKKKKAKRENFR